MYTLGVVLSFLIIATVLFVLRAQGEQIGWGFQLQSPIFVGIMIIVFFVIFLMLLDIVHFRNPLANHMEKLTFERQLLNSFVTGFFAVLIASPCTAPFMGIAIGYTLTAPLYVYYPVFLALSLGYALPFALAGLFPKAIHKVLPRPGKWMDLLKKIFAILALFAFAIGIAPTTVVTPAQAFLPKIDAGKTGSKISLWFQKVKSSCEKAMQWVSNSKMGKLVGDGIKATKDGVNFAKDMYKQGMDIYNQGKEYADAAKNSKEYKSAMLGKEIAQESKKLAKIQQQMLKIQENAKQEQELLQETTNQKLAALQSNLGTMENYLAENIANGADTSGLKQTVERVNSESTTLIEQIKREFSQKSKAINDDMDDQLDELKEQQEAQTEVIAKLTKELAELNEVSFNVENPLESLQNTKNEIFLKKGVKDTVSSRKNLREKRFEERRNMIYEIYEKSVRAKGNMTGLVEDVNLIKELSETMPGEAEGSGVNVEILVRQIDILEKYVEFVLADLALETSVAATQLPPNASEGELTDFKLCNYTKSQAEINKEKLAALKAKVSKAKEKVTSTVDKVKEGAELAKGVGEVVQSGKEVLTNNPNAVVGGMF